jgi:predicted DNA-binding protein (MmcQ/YjbR family)
MHPDVPQNIKSRLRKICLALPGVREETAWTGVRWTVGSKNFAHVLMIDRDWPPAYAKAVATAGPCCVLTFRSPLLAVDESAFRNPPFFKPVWWPDIAGMKLDGRVDWKEVSQLVQGSYNWIAKKGARTRS